MATPAPPRLPPGERLRRAGIAAWSVIGILILLAILVWALFKISVIFPPLGLAVLIIYVLNPLVTRLERRRIPRAAAVGSLYVVFFGLLALLITLLWPVIAHQISSFADDWPEFRRDMVVFVQDVATKVEDATGTEIDTSQATCLIGGDDLALADAPTHERCDQVTEDLREALGRQAGRITEIGSSVLEVVLVLILGPLIALYLLIDLPQLKKDLVNIIPETHRDEALDVGTKIGRAVGGFFRGQLLVAFIVGLLCAIGFKIIGLPFWLILAFIAGFTNLIPLIGPFIGGGLGFFVGAISEGIGLGLKAALVALIVQQLDNHVISPNVMRRTVNLHPVTVMVALLAGGALAGFWGILLAVPGVASAKLLLGHLWATRVLGAEVSPYAPARNTAPADDT